MQYKPVPPLKGKRSLRGKPTTPREGVSTVGQDNVVDLVKRNLPEGGLVKFGTM